MQWWVWLLIAVAVIVIGYLKIAFFKSLKKKRERKKFTDED
ncbi:MAG: hypothetical protein R2876_01940 [Eubacteriales bacterium]